MGSRHGGMGGAIKLGQRVVALVAIALLAFGLGSCAKPIQPTELISEPSPQPNRLTGQMAEVSPPEALETLKQIIDAYTPQVRILSPRPGEVLNETTATVRLQVRGLPLFKNETWQLGPHLHLFLDGEPYKAIYDPAEPIVFEGLSPGTHTLRVFASRPWHESFKNQGAFDQRTFHIYAQTPQNEVNAKTPLLTYSRPQGSYGAEPIMLDFYLTNAPLHMSAQAEDNDDLHDWRIRCTVNDQSFVFDQWQPIWLKGFKPGRNWVQLELIDDAGNPIENRFNNTVRVIDYEPGGTDTLSRLVRGELDLQAVAGIIDPTYQPPMLPEPEVPAVPQLLEPDLRAPELAPSLGQPSTPSADPDTLGVSPEPEQPQLSPQEPTATQPSPSPDLTPRSSQRREAVPTLDQPDAAAPPNPFLRPEKSPESSAAAEKLKDPEAEKTLIEEIQEILDEAMAEGTPEFADEADESSPQDTTPQNDDLTLPTLPEPTAISPGASVPERQPQADRPSAKNPASKGLIDRFKQWRDQTTPAPQPPSDRSAAPNPGPAIPDQFAEPQPTPEDSAPSLPRLDPVEPSTPNSSELEPAPQSPSEAEPAPAPPESEAPVDPPRPDLSRPAPRSPIAPELRPFI